MTDDRPDQPPDQQSGRRRLRRRPRRRLVSSISLTTRLAMVALVVTLLSLLVTAAVGLVRGNDLADELADDRLVSIAASHADAVELYFQGIGREVVALAASPGTRDAIDQLTEAYVELNAQPVEPALTTDLTEYYLAEVVPALEAARGGVVAPSFLMPDGDAAVYLQANYVVPIVDQNGEQVDPAVISDAGDGSDYSALHATVHETYGQIALRSGFRDLFLIAAREDVIVYSARKDTDFATSLDLGPLSGSSFARLIDSLATDPAPAGYAISDFAAYTPLDDEPISFVASAVVDGGVVVGYVAAALDVSPLDAVLSGDGTWPGFGDSGDAYLAGTDATMRSTARPFQESPATFLAASTEPGPGQLTEAQRRTIAATGTTALVQGVNRNVVTRAEEGAGTVENPNYAGTEVLTAYRPVEVGDLGWVIFADVPTAELNEPVEQYARSMLFAVALFVVVVTFIAVRWSNRLMAPIRSIANRLRAVRADPTEDHRAVGGITLPPNSPEEYDELADNIDQMLERLEVHQRDIAQRSNERRRLLRQFLPAGVARRSEEGDGELIDHVRNASVVVLVVEGVGASIGDGPQSQMRDMLTGIVDEADALATDLGLERIKVTGGMYVAVCGVSRPYLDHAPRAVAFGLAARDLVTEVTGDRLSLRVGVDTGEISVGLAERTGLVYDAWGRAVERAERLAGGCPVGAVAVSAAVRQQLPDAFVIADDGEGTDAVSIVTDHLRDRAAT